MAQRLTDANKTLLQHLKGAASQHPQEKEIAGFWVIEHGDDVTHHTDLIGVGMVRTKGLGGVRLDSQNASSRPLVQAAGCP